MRRDGSKALVSIALGVALIMSTGCETSTDAAPPIEPDATAQDSGDAEVDAPNEDDADTNSAPDTGPDPDEIVSLQLSPDEITLRIGETEPLEISATNAAGQAAPVGDVVITSDDPQVAEVSSGGFAIARGVGQANLTASAGDIRDTILVTVQPRPLSTLEVAPRNRTIGVGERLQMDALLTDDSGASADEVYAVAWTSQNEDVVVVDGAGVVIGVAAGDAEVTAQAGGLAASANITVEVPTVEIGAVAVAPTQANLFLGERAQLSASVSDTTGGALGGVSVGWRSTDTSVAVVDADGLVRAVGGGQATVIASIAGFDAVSNITVDAAFSALESGGEHGCGLIGPTAYCWGANGRGQLGRGSTSTVGDPAPVVSPQDFVAISAGAQHTCALDTSGDAWCWGANADGQLGDGSTTDRDAPVKVSGLRSLVAISAGARHTCATDTSQQLSCWGANESSQLGDRSTTARTSPVSVYGAISGLSAGDRHTCAWSSGGDSWCWGANDQGQLGTNTRVSSSAPVAVTGGYGFAALATGARHTCGLLSAGSLACWGANDRGQVGDGSAAERITPILLSINETLSGVTAGRDHACALAAGGFVYCWGAGDRGQLGDGAGADANAPVEVDSTRAFIDISAGEQHVCGLDDAGSIWCWGDGDRGQLGSGRGVERSPIELSVPR